MAGNGYFAEGRYQAKSTETWDDLTANWDTFTSGWELTPDLPLEFTTGVVDFGRKETLNPLTELSINGIATTTIYYGDSVDSSGGSIDSPSSVTYSPGDSVSAIEARYFQFKISVDHEDSAAATSGPITISGIKTNLTAEIVTVAEDSIDSSTLTGTTGVRQLTAIDSLSSVRSAVITPHASSALIRYVADDYVADGDSGGGEYVEITESDLILPYITLDKTTNPITLYIRDLNTYGKTAIDCTFDAVLTGLAPTQVDVVGNIIEG